MSTNNLKKIKTSCSFLHYLYHYIVVITKIQWYSFVFPLNMSVPNYKLKTSNYVLVLDNHENISIINISITFSQCMNKKTHTITDSENSIKTIKFAHTKRRRYAANFCLLYTYALLRTPFLPHFNVEIFSQWFFFTDGESLWIAN